MNRYELSVVGMSEVRSPGRGEIVSGNYIIFYSLLENVLQ
jgi:hypothetical protein